MSNVAVLDRPRDETKLDWIILDPPEDRPAGSRVRVVGQGAQRHGIIPRGRATAGRPNLVALPAVDDLV